MQQIRQTTDVQEPLGIVITDGGRREEPPKFSAYIWGPAPEPTATESSEPKAA